MTTNGTQFSPKQPIGVFGQGWGCFDGAGVGVDVFPGGPQMRLFPDARGNINGALVAPSVPGMYFVEALANVGGCPTTQIRRPITVVAPAASAPPTIIPAAHAAPIAQATLPVTG